MRYLFGGAYRWWGLFSEFYGIMRTVFLSLFRLWCKDYQCMNFLSAGTKKKLAAVERWPLAEGRNVKAKPLQQTSLDNWIRLCRP